MCAERRVYLRTVIAAVVHELRQRRPGIHLEARLIRAAQWRIGDEAIAVDVAAAEESLDAVLHVSDVTREIVQGRLIVRAERRLVEQRAQ